MRIGSSKWSVFLLVSLGLSLFMLGCEFTGGSGPAPAKGDLTEVSGSIDLSSVTLPALSTDEAKISVKFLVIAFNAEGVLAEGKVNRKGVFHLRLPEQDDYRLVLVAQNPEGERSLVGVFLSSGETADKGKFQIKGGSLNLGSFTMETGPEGVQFLLAASISATSPTSAEDFGFFIPPTTVDANRIIIPREGRLEFHLVNADAWLRSDLWEVSPTEQLLMKNHDPAEVDLPEVFPRGQELELAIEVDARRLGLGIYRHSSLSGYARVTALSETSWRVEFEDLPWYLADFDFNDLVIDVVLVPLPDLDGDLHGDHLEGGSDWCDQDPNNWTDGGCANCIDGDGDGSYVACDRYQTIAGPDCNDADARMFGLCLGSTIGIPNFPYRFWYVKDGKAYAAANVSYAITHEPRHQVFTILDVNDIQNIRVLGELGDSYAAEAGLTPRQTPSYRTTTDGYTITGFTPVDNIGYLCVQYVKDTRIYKFMKTIDISDDYNPRDLGITPRICGCGPAFLRDETAYVIGQRWGVYAFDVSDPTDPSVISDLQFTRVDGYMAPLENLGGVFGNYLYLVDDREDFVADISDPAHMFLVLDLLKNTRYSSRFVGKDDLVFVKDEIDAMAINQVIQDPLKVVKRSSIEIGRFSEPIATYKNFLLVLDENKPGVRLVVYDISEPSQPTYAGYLPLPYTNYVASSVLQDGNRLYLRNDGYGLVVVTLQN